MANSNGPIIDMTRDGAFIDPPKPGIGSIIARVAMFGVLLLVAAMAFWAALFLIPVVMLLGVAGYFLARHQMKRNGFVFVRR